MPYTPDTYPIGPTATGWHDETTAKDTPLAKSNLDNMEDKLATFAVAQATKVWQDLTDRINSLPGGGGPSATIINGNSHTVANTDDPNSVFVVTTNTGSFANVNIVVPATTPSIPVGTSYLYVRFGTSTVTFTGSTVISPFDFFVITPQSGQASLIKVNTTDWVLGGYLGA